MSVPGIPLGDHSLAWIDPRVDLARLATDGVLSREWVEALRDTRCVEIVVRKQLRDLTSPAPRAKPTRKRPRNTEGNTVSDKPAEKRPLTVPCPHCRSSGWMRLSPGAESVYHAVTAQEGPVPTTELRERTGLKLVPYRDAIDELMRHGLVRRTRMSWKDYRVAYEPYERLPAGKAVD